MEKLNVLVTGGAGFIGSHLVDALVERGHQVRVLDALVEQVHGGAEPRYLNPKAEFVRADVCDREAVDRALEGVEVVYHKAAEVGVGQSMYEIERYVRANDMGTAVLLEAVVRRRPQVRKLVVASSMSIYGEGAYACGSCSRMAHPKLRPASQLLERRWEVECERCGSELRPVATNEDKPLFPTSVYAVSKQDQEQYCLVVGRAYNIPSVALRYFNVYGTRQALSNPYTGVCAIFSSRLLNDERPVIFEDGEQTRDFVHVRDIVRANLLALETDRADYQSVNIGTGRPISIREVALMLARGLGKDIEPEIVARYREGDIRHCVADITRARDLLGYEPTVTLEDGIPELLSWVREQEAADQVTRATAELESRQLVR
ncbi:MAG TPA: SDR family NAD(P)-dependent oxidoreductase [Pyrinomonadaceae bacterium]|jgi:dTDP-L-rhamnose 4-epimerase|nr:SDR family NAD(P)-dependent oxidoreductase [Pyrinomonadaceae bacterium]